MFMHSYSYNPAVCRSQFWKSPHLLPIPTLPCKLLALLASSPERHPSHIRNKAHANRNMWIARFAMLHHALVMWRTELQPFRPHHYITAKVNMSLIVRCQTTGVAWYFKRKHWCCTSGKTPGCGHFLYDNCYERKKAQRHILRDCHHLWNVNAMPIFSSSPLTLLYSSVSWCLLFPQAQGSTGHPPPSLSLVQRKPEQGDWKLRQEMKLV